MACPRPRHSVIDANVIDTNFFSTTRAVNPALRTSLAAGGRA
jgi:hypothetical protein